MYPSVRPTGMKLWAGFSQSHWLVRLWRVFAPKSQGVFGNITRVERCFPSYVRNTEEGYNIRATI